MCWEFGGGIWGRGRRVDIRVGEFMEMDLRVLKEGLGIETEFGLVEVGGQSGVLDEEVVGSGDEAGEVKELV